MKLSCREFMSQSDTTLWMIWQETRYGMHSFGSSRRTTRMVARRSATNMTRRSMLGEARRSRGSSGMDAKFAMVTISDTVDVFYTNISSSIPNSNCFGNCRFQSRKAEGPSGERLHSTGHRVPSDPGRQHVWCIQKIYPSNSRRH
jgi:hypothetical protein